ncbi:hypothetical protein CcrMagneto_gp131 [Caulobacter virus Magneto]|uniref:hypothetical protein n=1 Tax=Caulobacter virus Magneto TaxID=1211642 RepID=UPI00028B2584|nr:hypothetical protein CcrMagneto_gp131 [Caulobacter virus Magneto]AFU87301.1 hypothetical protein CcrMagneto_gp131 [Caulobacter virus Magneto]
MIAMKTGDCATMTNCTIEMDTEMGPFRATFKAPKGERFVFLLLGTEKKGGPALDVVAALQRLGWHPEDPEAAAQI